MKLTIGVMGSSGGDLSAAVRDTAYRLGEAIATGSGLMGREITNIRSCDIVVFAGGRTGTLGELAIAYDEGRLIGILTGTGGITEIVQEIIRVSGKNTGACLLYDDDPKKLVERLIEYYRTEHIRKPSCFCDSGGEG